MFAHVFLFQWKPGTTPEQKQRATAEIQAFQGAIPGLVSTAVGPNVSPHGGDYTFGGVMHFTDRAAFESYVTHPQHQALLAWLVPLVTPIELDLEA